MKKTNYIIAYISALVIGVLLLIFHDSQSIYNSVVIAIGILVGIPSLVLFFTELCSKVPQGKGAGMAGVVKWSSVIAALVGVALALWMICSPGFFVRAIIYTLGAILILVGIFQMVAIYQSARPLHPSALWFIVPTIALVAGVVIILLGPGKITAFAGLITGIVLVVYAVNGFAATGREAKLANDIAAMEAEKAREELEDKKKK